MSFDERRQEMPVRLYTTPEEIRQRIATIAVENKYLVEQIQNGGSHALTTRIHDNNEEAIKLNIELRLLEHGPIADQAAARAAAQVFTNRIKAERRELAKKAADAKKEAADAAKKKKKNTEGQPEEEEEEVKPLILPMSRWTQGYITVLVLVPTILLILFLISRYS